MVKTSDLMTMTRRPRRRRGLDGGCERGTMLPAFKKEEAPSIDLWLKEDIEKTKKYRKAAGRQLLDQDEICLNYTKKKIIEGM